MDDWYLSICFLTTAADSTGRVGSSSSDDAPGVGATKSQLEAAAAAAAAQEARLKGEDGRTLKLEIETMYFIL